MVIMIGGAHQGKLAFAMQNYGVTKEDVVDQDCKKTGKILNNFHLLVRKILKENWIVSSENQKMVDSQHHKKKDDKANNNRDGIESLDNCVDHILQEYKDGIIICDEVGCGLVPMDAFERTYRDMVGRCMCKLTAQADEVIRISCGIPQRIK